MLVKMCDFYDKASANWCQKLRNEALYVMTGLLTDPIHYQSILSSLSETTLRRTIHIFMESLTHQTKFNILQQLLNAFNYILQADRGQSTLEALNIEARLEELALLSENEIVKQAVNELLDMHLRQGENRLY
jgi:hypothetical protein